MFHEPSSRRRPAFQELLAFEVQTVRSAHSRQVGATRCFRAKLVTQFFQRATHQSFERGQLRLRKIALPPADRASLLVLERGIWFDHRANCRLSDSLIVQIMLNERPQSSENLGRFPNQIFVVDFDIVSAQSATPTVGPCSRSIPNKSLPPSRPAYDPTGTGGFGKVSPTTRLHRCRSARHRPATVGG